MRATVCAAPNSVSRLLGKLEVKRHFTFSLVCWAKAGDAASVASAAAGANCRRVMVMSVSSFSLPKIVGRQPWYRYQKRG